MGFPLGASLASGVTTYLADATGGWQGALRSWGFVALGFAAVWLIVVREPRGSKDTVKVSLALPESVARNFPLWIVAASLFLKTSIFSLVVAWFPTFLVGRGVVWQGAGFAC